jgi:hypothetical protein
MEDDLKNGRQTQKTEMEDALNKNGRRPKKKWKTTSN